MLTRQADRIRQCVEETYFAPARENLIREIEVRAGDVHHWMGLSNAMPAVCSALAGRKLEQLSGTTIILRTGPVNGANTCFRYLLGTQQPGKSVEAGRNRAQTRERAGSATTHETIMLVSCVKSKLSHEAPARQLYISHWFTLASCLAEAGAGRWYILSAEYGLVEPDAVIRPYDRTLNTMRIEARRAWAHQVYRQLTSCEPSLRLVVMFAGARYREFLTPHLQSRGVSVEVPMEHLRQGEQLRWMGTRI